MPDPIRRRVSGRVLPPGWSPPAPFPMRVVYWDRARAADVLWTTPWLLDGEGRVVDYLAAGPAGQPAGEGLVARIDVRGMPAGTHVKVIMDKDRGGAIVYGVPRHTAN